MKKPQKVFAVLLVLIMIFTMVAGLEASATAPTGGKQTAKITSKGQVVDSVTLNGITVQAKYEPYYSTYGSDSDYRCSRLVSRFYSEVFGITVANMWGPGYAPSASSGSFSTTTSPKIGDVVRFNTVTHWAIVKAVSGTTVTIIEQSAWYSTSSNIALTDRKIQSNDSDYTFFRYSGNNSTPTTTTTTAAAKPSNPTISVNKTSITLGESLTFTLNSTNAQYYYMSIYRGNTSVIAPRIDGGGVQNYTFKPTETGNYQAWITAWNSSGSAESTKVSFTVNPVPTKPTNPTISVNKPSITVGESLTFTFSATNATSCDIEIDRDGIKGITTLVGNTGNSRAYSPTVAGNYTARLIASNSVGSVTSSSVTFTVNSPVVAKPTNAQISINKNSVLSGEPLYITLSATGATYYTVNILENGNLVSSELVSGGGTKNGTFTAIPEGNYTAYMVASNSGGSVESNRVNFVVTKPTQATTPTTSGVNNPDTPINPTTTTEPTQPQKPKPISNRIYGSNRTDTAIATSIIGWTKTDNVVLVSSQNFPDALAGGSLAYMLDAPILSTKGVTIEPTILNRIAELEAKNIYILGGTAVISDGIFNQLKDAGYNVIRLAGADRYETSIAIAKKMDEIRNSPPELIFISDGLNYADALSATPIAGIKGVPIIFTPNNKTGFNAVSADYASKCGAKQAVILGGTSAVKQDVATKLAELGFASERVYGSDRYATSAEIYKKYKGSFSGDKAILATGRDFPDALAGGALGGKMKSPLLLVNGTGTTSTPIKSAINEMSPKNVYILGGNAVVTDTVVNNHLG